MNEFLGTKEDILNKLDINPKIGLTEEAKKLSLEKYGRNSFTKEKGISLFENGIGRIRTD